MLRSTSNIFKNILFYYLLKPIHMVHIDSPFHASYIRTSFTLIILYTDQKSSMDCV